MVCIKNDNLSVEIAEMGAEIKRIKLDGVDVLWDGNPDVWSGTAPILFPICGGLKNDKYIYNGKEYTLTKHGFAKRSTFTVENNTGYCATLLLRDSDETFKVFPWHFEFRITYTLIGRSVRVEFKINNLSDDAMYMSVGSHEAYLCPEGIEDYDIIFDKKETLNSCCLDGDLLVHKSIPIIKETRVLPLYDSYFKFDTLVFKDLKSRIATLRNRKTGRSITVDFDGCDYFLLWTKPDAPYICLEPWCGIPSMVDDGYDLTKKEGINKVDSGREFVRVHTIHF